MIFGMSPRLRCAGATTRSSAYKPVSVRADLVVPETQPLGPLVQRSAPPAMGSFPPVNPTPIPPGMMPPGAVPPNPYQTSPPPYGSQGGGHYPPPQGSYDPMQGYPPQPSGDQGLKALVALIVFLAVALAIVLLVSAADQER